MNLQEILLVLGGVIFTVSYITLRRIDKSHQQRKLALLKKRQKQKQKT